MKTLALFFVLIFSPLTNLSAQDIVFPFNTNDFSNTLNKPDNANIDTNETSSVEGLNISTLHSFVTDTIPNLNDSNKTKRLSFNLYMGIGGRLPLSDSYYNLWKDLAIGDRNYDASDGWGKAIAANWPDYFFSFLRADLDFSISKNLSIGLFAYPDNYKKVMTFSGKTDNWTGDDSNALEDHWKLKRKLRLATHNFGPDIKFKVPINDWELSLSYLYGWSYLWRSSFEYSYFNQETGTGEKGFLGLVYAKDGNITKLRYNGSANFHRLELGFTKFMSGHAEKTVPVALKVGYQFQKMDNLRYEVLKFDSEVYDEAFGYFDTGELRVYEIGDSGDVYIENQKLELDLSSVYVSLMIGLRKPRK